MRYPWIIASVVLGLCLSSCMQTQNSSSQDKSTYADLSGPFGVAKSIIAQNCANCHDFHTLSEDALVSRGVLVKGDPEHSKIYFRLVGSSGGGTKNMPTGGALSAGEVGKIYDWILQAN